MTVDEFKALRDDLAGLRSGMERLRGDIDARFATLRVEMDVRFTTLRADMDVRFARVEAKIDEKPSSGTIYQATFGMLVGIFALMASMIVVLKSTGFIP
jgi:hypothetical protein